MKTLVIAMLGLGLGAGLRAENLSTTDGTTYSNITVQRTDPDGLCIAYTPAGGGMGVAKVKFSQLSADQQKQFGYDPARAQEFEAQCAQATAAYKAQAVQWDAAAQAARSQRQAQDLEWEQQRAQNEFNLAMAQLQTMQAANNASGYYGGGWSLGGGYTLTAIPALRGSLRTVNGGLEVVPPKVTHHTSRVGQLR
jgi:hypothetical protein